VRTPEIKLGCSDEKKFEIVDQITQTLAAKYAATLIDGIRLAISDTGWGLVRASNTSPYLTVRVEGKTKEEVLQIKNILARELEKYPEVQDTLDTEHVASLSGKLGWR